ncbi:uncharacterized protein [Euphorbia lathyris]|uniref:uncharacterized protein n=1 Tax=Euphorbia lathyris TaxID=212925 RepID=UPI0033133587
MEVSSSLPESAQPPQSQPQPQSDPQTQPQPQQQLQLQPQPQLNPQIHDQSQQYPQQPNQIQDYYYQNPAQVYDQSYYSYYQQYPYQNQWQYPQQPQNYAYYPPDYAAAYQQQPLTQQPPESGPAVSAQGMQIADASGTAAPQVQVLQQPQHHQQIAYPPVQSSGNVVVPPGMNPAAAAAIAALERLTQFAGTMDAAERAMAGIPAYNPNFVPMAMRPPDARHLHRGRGRRGGGWVNVGHRNGSAPPSRGRGRGRGPRGRGRFRHGQERGAPSSSHPEPSSVIADAAQSAPAPENEAPNHRQVQIAWCELCRVDCTSSEILEQHKNGKRHKKNLLRFEELKNKTKPGEEISNDHVPVIDSNPEATQQAQVAQVIQEQKAVENLPSESTSKEPMIENNLQNDAAKLPEVPAEASDQPENQPRVNKFENRKHGTKRKIKGGRGAKRETRRRTIEPPKPKVVIPLICDLCNVKCDTREVLDRHLSGKKHIAKLKRFEGHQAMYGSQGLQVLYPPNPIAQTHFIPQVHQPFCGPMGSFPPQGGPFPSQPHQPTAVLDPQVSQISMPQVPEATVIVEANPTSAV